MAAGPSDFPFEDGDLVAARVLAPAGEAWFAGTLTARGSGGLLITSAHGLRMWLPWDQAVIRDLSDVEKQGEGLDP